ncbi:hypothetical protein [Pseudomonas sp. NPDC089396]|uniref:hypothetical protein n=1 Tax=Pseudomonas sp. NPDC089396 TaxID=3364461 RepID=UPI003839BA45
MNTTELNRKQALAKVVNELNRLYPQGGYDAAALASAVAAPDFITTRSGHNRQFTREASIALGMLCYAWTKEVPKLAIRMDVKELLTCLRQAVGDLHADRLLDGDESENLKLLDDTVNKILECSQVDFVHSFPAWTLGMEYEHPFVVGPVSIMSRNQWLDSVDFNDYAKRPRALKSCTSISKTTGSNWPLKRSPERLMWLPRLQPLRPSSPTEMSWWNKAPFFNRYLHRCHRRRARSEALMECILMAAEISE